MKLLSVLLTITSFSLAFAESLQESIRGTYDIELWNGQPFLAKVEFKSTSNLVGYELSGALTIRSRMTPIDKTTFSRTDNGVRQNFEGTDTTTEIEYSFVGNTLQVITSHCIKNLPCQNDSFVPAWSKNFGNEIDFKTFSKQIEGAYDILSANGEVPASTENIGDVVIEANEADITFPFCPKGSNVCMPGNTMLPYSNCRAFRREISKNRSIVTVEVTGASLKRYQWDDNSGNIVFRNFQVKLPSNQLILVEHNIKKRTHQTF